MRYLIFFILFLFSLSGNAQLRDFQIRASTPFDSLYLMGTDTASASTKYGLGKWYNAYDLVNNLVSSMGGGANLSIGQSGGTQVIQSNSGTDVGIRNLYGLLITEGATDTLHFRVDSSLFATQYDITQIPISSLKAAAANNTINNANYNQEWQWNTLSSGTGLKLSSTSTAAASSTQKLFEVSLSGNNGSAGQTTYAGYFSNTHGGSTPINYGLYSTVSGGIVNYGLYGVVASSNDIALYANSSAGTGVYSFSTTGVPFKAYAEPTSTNTVVNLMDLSRQSSGTAAAGIGGNITFTTETATSSAVSNTITSTWTTATHASRVSDFIVSGVNAAVTADLLTIKGSGKTVLNKYGVGSFTSGTPTYNIVVDASGNLMEAAVPVGGTNSIEENNSVVQSANVSLDFQNPFDVTADGGTEVNISFDGSEFTTVTTSESDDYLLMHDSGSSANQKILWTDLHDEIISFYDGTVLQGTGNAIDVGEGLDINMVSTEANINLDASEFQIDGAAEGTEYVLIHDTDTTAGHQIQRRLVSSFSGGTDTNFAEDDLTFTGNRSHDMDVYTLGLHGDAMNVTFKDDNGGTGDNIIIASELGAGTGVTGGISFESQNGGSPTDMFDIEANKLGTNESTLTIKSEQGTDAHTVWEKNAGLADNTTESHMAMNAGRAYTQNYEWSTASADLTLDRSYNIVNVSGSGAIGDEINLPEVASTSDNFDTGLTDAQVQVGQEYTITNFRAATNLVIRVFSGDEVNGTGSTTVSLAPHASVIVKCVRWSGGVGYWKTY